MDGLKPPEITVHELLSIETVEETTTMEARDLGEVFWKFTHEFTGEDENEHSVKMGEHFLKSLHAAGFAIVKIKK